jgi:hypothetical protein
MPVFGWIRDALGVHKDHVEKKKAQLDVKKLENEEREQNRLVKPATLDEIKEYDPTTQKLEYEQKQQRRLYEEERNRMFYERMREKDRRQQKFEIERQKSASKKGCLVSLFLVLLLAAILLIFR